MATPVGFEPTRAEPTHLAGERLNHSAKASHEMQGLAKGSEGRFRSSDLWVMSPTRFRCATSLLDVDVPGNLRSSLDPGSKRARRRRARAKRVTEERFELSPPKRLVP
jgi:hypothetical protein